MRRNYLIKSLFIAILVISPFISTFAIRAYPGFIKVTQPDGSTLTIKNHGDEFYHYTTTEDNFIVKQNAAGFFTYATIDTQGIITEGARIAKDPANRPISDSKYLVRMPEERLTVLPSKMKRSKSAPLNAGVMKKAFPVTGSGKSLIILVNFTDKAYVTSSPQTAFTSLLNQPGYSTNGGTGSAKDYFMASSYGKFSPQFDVVGPVDLPNVFSFYGANDKDGYDKNPGQMIVDACAAVDATVDFTQYDTDNDGWVDNVFVYYAGYNEAEFAAAPNTIWPHRWSISSAGITTGITFDEKKIEDYACTSELKGASGSNMCGIGTFCHEFGHVLGLPDYYNTDDSNKNTLNDWSIMDSGGYLNDGNTPPVYSAYDRFYLGYFTPEEISQPSNVTLLPLYQGKTIPANTTNQAFILSASPPNLIGTSPNPKEFFMVEYRKLFGWDAYLPTEGMLIWHIDFDQTAWDNNSPNNYTGTSQTLGSHMRVYLQPLSGSTTTPGTAFTSGNFTPTTWAGTTINRNITDIAKTSANVSFKLMGGSLTRINLGVIQGQLTYPMTFVGKTNPKNLNIATTGINDNLTVTLSGANAGYFTISTNTITQAAANSATGYDLLVTYKPLVAGSHNAVLTITGGGLPDKVINLSGTAQ